MRTVTGRHMSIGKRPLWEQLKMWRRTQKLSQERLAQKLDISPHTLWKWESGRVYPSRLAMYRLNQVGFFVREYPEDKDKDG